MGTNLDLAALKRVAEAVKDPSPWADVCKIVMSAARFYALRAKARLVTDTPLTLMAGFDVEISPVCDDKIAVLVGRRGEVLGLFSFVTGEVRWFDRKLMERFEEPPKLEARTSPHQSFASELRHASFDITSRGRK